jgi:hypothetical protein
MVEHLEVVSGAGSLLVRAVRRRSCEQRCANVHASHNRAIVVEVLESVTDSSVASQISLPAPCTEIGAIFTPQEGGRPWKHTRRVSASLAVEH